MEAFGMICAIDSIDLSSGAIRDSSLVLGTISGKLHRYTVVPGTSDSGVHLASACVRPVSSKKPVTDIRFLNASIILAVCDGKLSAYSVDTLEVLFRIAKNVDTFTLDKAEGSNQICVLSKKKVSIYQVQARAAVMITEVPTSSMPDLISTMEFQGSFVYFGGPMQYWYMEVATGYVYEQILVPIEGVSPVIQAISKDEILVLCNAGIGCFINLLGMPTSRNPVPLQSTPYQFALVDSHLFILSQGVMHIYFFAETPRLVQTVSVKPNAVLITDSRSIMVLSPNSLFILIEFPIERQIEQCISHLEISRGISLLYNTDPTPEQVRLFHKKSAIVLFKYLHFFEAVQHFQLSSTDPRELIKLFPYLCVESTSESPAIDSEPGLPRMEIDIDIVIRQGQKLLKEFISDDGGTHKRSMLEPVSTLEQREVFLEALRALTLFLVTWKQAGQLSSDPAMESVDTALLMAMVLLSSSHTPRLEFYRSRSSYFEIPGIRDLLFETNACSLDKCELFLIKHRRFRFLALLYQSKGMHRKALTSMREIANGTWEVPGCDGIDDTVAMLRQMDDATIVFEFAPWAIRKDPERGIRIFTDPNRKIDIAHTKVLNCLYELDESLQIVLQESVVSGILVQMYLEYIVLQLKTEVLEYHSKLASLYIERLKTIGNDNEEAHSEVRRRLREFLAVSSKCSELGIFADLRSLGMLDELAVLYSKSSRHLDMLELCVYDLNEHTRARKYCTVGGVNAVGTPGRPRADLRKSKELFQILINIYLNPNKSRLNSDETVDSFFDHALDVFMHHGDMVDARVLLERTPDDTPFARLLPALNKVFPKIAHRTRTLDITRNLSRNENLEVLVELNELKQGRVIVNSQLCCYVCNLPIHQQVFKQFPGGELVHYNCDGDFLLEQSKYRV